MELFSDLPRRLRRLHRKYLHDYSELDGILSPRLRSGASEIHGTGGFATQDIKAGQLIAEYIGELIPSAEGTAREARSLRENGTTYILIVDNDWDIDGSVGGGDASYINHSCDPNCSIEIDMKRRRVWIAAIKDIAKGEELKFDYRFDPVNDPLLLCRCGAKNCRGYINKFKDKSQLQDRLRIEEKKVQKTAQGSQGVAQSPGQKAIGLG